ncbi:MAG: 2-oxoacid:acceptor oxidoreductase subunit alpha [Verrucomicrobia bacterium]|nr:2-oxoacid:acceptor oxidoreductase subunit alpha [Verrucomicrobiota bacterium]
MVSNETSAPGGRGWPTNGKPALELKEHVVEVISDSGEGAQKCAQSFAAVAAKMGNGVWTVEIIPAEIQPPARSMAGASGNRIRVGSFYVTNGGDQADLVVAFNEQVLLGRLQAAEIKPGGIILLESKWATDPDAQIAHTYCEVRDRLRSEGYCLYEVPMETECLKCVSDARRGKNMFVLGLLNSLYSQDLDISQQQIVQTFGKKGAKVVQANRKLLEAGYQWAEANLDLKFRIPPAGITEPQIVVNGNTALALGIIASGMEVCAMYPITPATSASHYLSDVFEKAGGVVHQAEDEIAACCFAIGASYAGKCAVTITSGPGYSLKQEAIGLAAMGEIPLVVVNVQRGGPSTGQPTKMEQGDLLAACFGTHGDAPKVVMAAACIEDCFYSMIAARKIAETYRLPVIVLTDANLATAQQPFVRPKFQKEWVAPPIDQSPVPPGVRPYEWEARTGLSERFIPGRPGGIHTLTGLAHDRQSRVAYDPEVNQEGIHHRSLKLAAFQQTLKPPGVHGEDEGDLLVVGWGSTRGAIEEAVDRLRAEGEAVSALHLTFLWPMPSGLQEILRRFRKVLAVEASWCDRLEDDLVTEDNRRYSNLAWLLRARYLVDVDCWSEVKGQPIKPGSIEAALRSRLAGIPHRSLDPALTPSI